MSEKCRNKHNNSSDNPLTSRRTDGGKNTASSRAYFGVKDSVTHALYVLQPCMLVIATTTTWLLENRSLERCFYTEFRRFDTYLNV